MSSNFYTYAYDTNEFTQGYGPDKNPRAEGAMVWIPAGDPSGLIVYLGGIVDPHGNGTVAPQPLDQIFVYDATGNLWSTQTATGEIPQNRAQFCVDVAWAPDNSSFNIYLWGGLSVPPPVVNATSFNDVYVLSLPSFIWMKIFPYHHGNATLGKTGHYSASCNMVKSMSQMLVIGGTYTDMDDCDLAYDIWAQHNLWTGTFRNKGDIEMYWASYEPNVTGNAVPPDVYKVVGGNKDGGATLKKPKAGFDSGNKPLEDLLGQRPDIPQRTPSRHITVPTNSSMPTPPPTSSGSGKLSTGAIVGIAIGSAVGLMLILLVWYCVGRRVVRRQEERRRSEMTQPSYSVVSSSAGAPSMVNPSTSMGPWGGSPQLATPPPPPSELPTQQERNTGDVSELPQQRTENKVSSSPSGDNLS
ncbi:Kelch repeat-containing protein [Fusarium oxysporum f. sp. rapae]|uniref:Kelch repeat-containing protein n=1 Tax=Fusarium oxysporum f. sp. rapae TaxID=485398 RepID=A0A8J5NL49_FUSOX|nr:Kelch repeat-containing protein [Fusarium oxysporum f. sp. rapae]